MGAIVINTINKNIGSSNQQYRIEYRLEGVTAYTPGPTLNYNQTNPIPVGLLPVVISVPDNWINMRAEVRIVTICGQIQTLGDPSFVNITPTFCGPLTQPTAALTIKYGSTSLETYSRDPAESEFIASAQIIFNANQELKQSFVYNAPTITISNFGIATDRVMFIQVPGSEAPFTKWTEVGNIFQQNMNIDSLFAGNNLWFKTKLNGNTLYMTRIQTAFTGAIVLSR